MKIVLQTYAIMLQYSIQHNNLNVKNYLTSTFTQLKTFLLTWVFNCFSKMFIKMFKFLRKWKCDKFINPKMNIHIYGLKVFSIKKHRLFLHIFQLSHLGKYRLSNINIKRLSKTSISINLWSFIYTFVCSLQKM